METAEILLYSKLYSMGVAIVQFLTSNLELDSSLTYSDMIWHPDLYKFR